MIRFSRTELSAADLRREAAGTRYANASRRMLAIALVLEGRPRGEAAAQCGMDRQTLRDWAHRYNAEGIAGLYDRRGRPGPKPRLSPAQEAEMERWVEAGPDPAEHDGLVRWRRVDLRDRIKERFAVRLHERTVGKLLRNVWPAPSASGSRVLTQPVCVNVSGLGARRPPAKMEIRASRSS